MENNENSPQSGGGGSNGGGQRKRRRGSRGGRNRKPAAQRQPQGQSANSADDVELPDPPNEGRVQTDRKPQIGDTRPAPAQPKPEQSKSGNNKKRRRRGNGGGRDRNSGRSEGRGSQSTDADVIERRRGRERDGRPLGRYMMCVQVRDDLTQVAVLEGRSLTEHYVSSSKDDPAQIHGNIYLGRVQNVLPGMEAAFVDIGTPKNAVLYRGDVQYDQEV